MKNVNSLIEGWVKQKPTKGNPNLEMTQEEFSQTLNSPKSDDMKSSGVRRGKPGKPEDKFGKKSTKVKKKSTKVKKKSTKVKGRPAAPSPGHPAPSAGGTRHEVSEDQGMELSPDCDFGTPTVFKCGHTNYKHHGTTEDNPLQVKAREEEFCCQALRETTLRSWKMNPRLADKRRMVHLSVAWQVRGLYESVPKAIRKSPEKQRGLGWPGLCCDPATGLYIGGLGNNCRHYHSGPERCVIHATKKVVDFSDEEV